MIQELIASALIIDSLSATAKDGALDEILEKIVEDGRIARRDLPPVRKALLEREAKGSTGIGNGVAVPHVKGKEVKQMSLVLARSQAGIAFDSIDGRPVHTVFLILAPQNEADSHLQALRWISSLARNADFRRFVLGAKGAEQIRELLQEMSGPAR